MQTIYSTSKEFTPEFERAVAVYRHKIFIERLGWQLPVQDGLERDQFDRPDTIYVVAKNDEGDICGCARLLPTTSPYLLGEVFPGLMNGAPVPCQHDVWELSRFAAADLKGGVRENANSSRHLLGAAVVSAAAHGASRLITVSPLGIERLLARMGVHAHRAGPPLFIDGKPVFACWIEIDAQTVQALGVADLVTLPAPAPSTH
ncbi:acyl-homoserine-lactone synthase [Massilia sp. W12]|uniref:acyl-homoserine-lactone synthase n=1 Tax=Massilia sp. W12 TaxID=3126507 RepID=UPI0030CCF0D0